MKPRIAGFVLAMFMFTVMACNNEEKQEPEKKTETKPAPTEAEKTKVSVSPDGAELKTKDVEVKFDTKDTTKN